MSNKLQPLSEKAKAFIQMEARAVPKEQIMVALFNIGPDCTDEKLINKANQQMYRWRHHPYAKQYWEEQIAQVLRDALPGALKTLVRQSTNDDGEVKKGWLANKASNDLTNLAKNVGVIKTEETALQIQINGMPDIGSPDDDQ